MTKVHAERLLFPMVRDRQNGRRGELRRASWDEALGRAAEGLRAAIAKGGGKAVGIFSCSKTTNELNYAVQKFARLALGSNNIDSCNRT